MNVGRPSLNKQLRENNVKQLEAFKTEIQFLRDVYQEAEVNLGLTQAEALAQVAECRKTWF